MSRKTVYAGIGSRETPVPILSIMTKFAYAVAETHILRTGGALGADDAFYKGAKKWCDEKNHKYENHIEIFLPWDGFNGHKKGNNKHIWSDLPLGASMIAEKYHPKYEKLKEPAQKLMARNTQQIMGRLLHEHTDFVVCYTSDGRDSGGTGQALRIARDLNIPVFNLFHREAYHYCMEYIKK